MFPLSHIRNDNRCFLLYKIFRSHPENCGLEAGGLRHEKTNACTHKHTRTHITVTLFSSHLTNGYCWRLWRTQSLKGIVHPELKILSWITHLYPVNSGKRSCVGFYISKMTPCIKYYELNEWPEEMKGRRMDVHWADSICHCERTSAFYPRPISVQHHRMMQLAPKTTTWIWKRSLLLQDKHLHKDSAKHVHEHTVIIYSPAHHSNPL